MPARFLSFVRDLLRVPEQARRSEVMHMAAYAFLSAPVWLLVALLTRPFPRWSAFLAEVHRNPRNTARVGSLGLGLWSIVLGFVAIAAARV